MAKYWYYAVCDEHKEACTCMVNNPTTSFAYLSQYSRQIQGWLTKHYACNLRLVQRDDELDKMWEDGIEVFKFREPEEDEFI